MKKILILTAFSLLSLTSCGPNPERYDKAVLKTDFTFTDKKLPIITLGSKLEEQVTKLYRSCRSCFFKKNISMYGGYPLNCFFITLENEKVSNSIRIGIDKEENSWSIDFITWTVAPNKDSSFFIYTLIDNIPNDIMESSLNLINSFLNLYDVTVDDLFNKSSLYK